MSKIPKAQCRKCTFCKYILDGKVVCEKQSKGDDGNYCPIPDYCRYFGKINKEQENDTGKV